ncbi:zinc finger protein 11 [Patella vulgata]|uniref:zinc finger protein 11 n=1 Tax=Patella vulgata TaxID=6465 RepID=UPI0021800511|nr:zinc finger protein 11 [Patella vulgata]
MEDTFFSIPPLYEGDTEEGEMNQNTTNDVRDMNSVGRHSVDYKNSLQFRNTDNIMNSVTSTSCHGNMNNEFVNPPPANNCHARISDVHITDSLNNKGDNPDNGRTAIILQSPTSQQNTHNVQMKCVQNQLENETSVQDEKLVDMSDISAYTKKMVENALSQSETTDSSNSMSYARQEKMSKVEKTNKGYSVSSSSSAKPNSTRKSDELKSMKETNLDEAVRRETTKVTGSDDVTLKTCIRCKAMFTNITDEGVALSKDDNFTCRSCTESSAEDCAVGDFRVDLKYGDKTNKLNMGEKLNKNVGIKILGLEKSNEGDLVFEITYGKKTEKISISQDDLVSGEMTIKFKTEKQIIRPFIPANVQQFPCSDCGDSFRETRTLANHKLTHPCIKPWVCLDCGKEFKYKNLMLRHKLSHTDIKDHVCNVCNKAFRTKANLKRHRLGAHKDAVTETKTEPVEASEDMESTVNEIPTVVKTRKRKVSVEYDVDSGSAEAPDDEDDDYYEETDDKPSRRNSSPRATPSKIRYNCKMCEKGFTNKSKWKRHELYHFQMRMPVCEICERSFVDKDYLMEHIRTHEDKFADYICKICGMEFPFTDELQHHVEGHSSPDESTVNNSDLQTNLTQNGSGSHNCDECNKSFRSNYILQRHLVTHNRATCQCQECGKFYSCRYNLAQHMMIHNTHSQYICDQCGESFKVKQYLSRHMIKHREQKTWACNLCDLKFYRQGNLRHHMKQHVEEKPFQCTHCQKAFVREKTLEEHILLTHTKERPFQCPVCGRGFGLRRMIKPHMKIHSGYKEHKCDECGKLFTYKSNLNQHMMVHSGEKPFICQYCGKGFARSKYLNDHMRTHAITVPNLPDISITTIPLQ